MIASSDYGNLRLHALGDTSRFSFVCQNCPSHAIVGAFLTGNARWFPDWDVERTVESSSIHCLWSLLDAEQACAAIGHELSQLGITDPEYRARYVNLMGHFIFTAARTSLVSRCRAVLIIIEIHLPRTFSNENASSFSRVVEFGGVGDEMREDQCSICLESYIAGSRVSTLACSHTYHEECIRRWFLQSLACPLCRSVQ